MQDINILIAGTNREILAIVVRLVNSRPQWRGIGVATVEEAAVQLEQQDIKLVLIGAGLAMADEERLTKLCSTINNTIPVVKHYGGGSGLLFAEIEIALGIAPK